MKKRVGVALFLSIVLAVVTTGNGFADVITYDTVCATTPVRLEAADSNGIRTVECSETNLGNLIADAYRVMTEAEIAFVEANEIASDINAGDVTFGEIFTALPAAQAVSVITLSGCDIMDALEMSVRLYPNANVNFLQVSGLTFDIQQTIISTVKLDTKGNFRSISGDYRVTNVKINGEKISLLKEYTVAATNTLLNGSSGYTMFSNGTVLKENAINDYEAFAFYVKDYLNGYIGTQYKTSEGRIDSIKLARQSEINEEIESKVDAKVDEILKNQEAYTAGLQAQINMLKEKVSVYELELKASSAFTKTGTTRKITVKWTPSVEIPDVSYQVWKSTKKTSGYEKLFTTQKTTYTNTSGLKKGNTYYYKVRAFKYIDGRYCYSDWSNVAYRKVSK